MAIHLYIRLVTGHSWVKEYEIKNAMEVINSRLGAIGIYIPSRETEVFF